MAKLRLCQLVAILSGKRTATEKIVTGVYHRFQKLPLFQGLSKRYTPNDEEGETFPDEKQTIQQKVAACLGEIRVAYVDTLDLMASQDKANCLAKATVEVDGKVILADIPATHLLWLEKRLIDLHTNLANIPTLDPQEEWKWDETSGCYVSEPSETNKTKKTPRTHVKYQATEQHPAQCEMYHEDVVVGRWRTLKFSAGIPITEKNQLLARVAAMRDAVKVARENANQIETVEVHYGDAMFDYILGVKK